MKVSHQRLLRVQPRRPRLRAPMKATNRADRHLRLWHLIHPLRWGCSVNLHCRARATKEIQSRKGSIGPLRSQVHWVSSPSSRGQGRKIAGNPPTPYQVVRGELPVLVAQVLAR